MNGAENVSAGAGSTASAPPPAPAATSTPPPADASASAGSASSEVAASTETGASQTTSDRLDALYEQYHRQPEVAAPVDQSAATAATPQEQPDGEQQPDGEEQPAPAETAGAETGEVNEVDPLADEGRIPTRDEINEQHKRAPKSIRDLAGDLAERLAAREEVVSQLGGDEGLQVAQAIIPHLFEPQVTDEAGHALFDAMTEANAPLVARMGQLFIGAALDDERSGAAFADRLLQEEFGEGYTTERLRELVDLDGKGLIDVETLRADEGFAREPTARERELEGQLAERDAELKQLRGDSKNATARQEQQRYVQVRQTISQAVMAEVLPLAETIGWVEKQDDKGPHAGLFARLGKLAIAEMNADIERTPEWNAIQELVRQGNAFKDGQPTRVMRVKLDAIKNRGKAMFKATARDLKPLISHLAGQKPADPPPPQTGRSGDRRDDTPPPPQQRQPPAPAERKLSTQEKLDQLYEKQQAHARDAGTQVGRR